MSSEVVPSSVTGGPPGRELPRGPELLPGPRVCAIADALSLVGDRWSLLVVRELGFGVHRFTDIQRHTGASREILTARLRKLENERVLARRRYRDRPPRDEYVLTEAGEALLPVLVALRVWGEVHVGR